MRIDFLNSKETFLTEFQNRKPYLMKHAIDPNFFTWMDVNELISRSNVTSKDFKLMNGYEVPKREYVEAYVSVGMVKYRLTKPVIYDYMRQGATLVMNKISGEPKINALERQISYFTGRETLTSGYAAFSGKSSFRNHWDTRDLFAIQLVGRKRWIVYKPTLEYPLYMQQSKDLEQHYPCPAEPYLDVVLEAGDVLYLPRGWWHDPIPLDGESFHLAVGTYPPFVLDYLKWACRQLPEFVEARMSFQTWDVDQEIVTSVGKVFDQFINTRENYQRFIDEFSSMQRVDSRFAIDIFGNQYASGVGEDMGIMLNAVRTVDLEHGYVIANGVKLNVDASSAPLIQHIADNPGVTLRELYGRFADMDHGKIKNLVDNLCSQDVLEMAV